MSETLEDTWPLRPGEAIVTAAARQLPDLVARTVAASPSDGSFRACGDLLHRLLCVETPFGKGVRELLGQGAPA